MLYLITILDFKLIQQQNLIVLLKVRYLNRQERKRNKNSIYPYPAILHTESEIHIIVTQHKRKSFTDF